MQRTIDVCDRATPFATQVGNTLRRDYDAVQLDDGFRCITVNCIFAPTNVTRAAQF